MTLLRQNIERTLYQNQSVPGSEFELMTLEQLYVHFSKKSPGPEQLDFYLLLLITEGEGWHKVDFQEYAWQRGTVFTVGKDQIQQFSEKRTGQGWILVFTENFIIRYFEQQEAFRHLLLFSGALVQSCFQLSAQQLQDVENLIHQLQDEYTNGRHDRFREGILRSSLHTLLLRLERYKQSTVSQAGNNLYLETFFRFKQQVEADCFTTRNVADYAEKLGFSEKKLNYITRYAINKPAKDFITDTCILAIKRLLISTDLSSKEIAYQTGFDEPTNFVKYFKRYSGQLPSEFRKRVQ